MTVPFNGVNFEVEYTFIKGCEETFHQMGCDDTIEIDTVLHCGGVMNQFFEEMGLWDALEEATWAVLNGEVEAYE